MLQDEQSIRDVMELNSTPGNRLWEKHLIYHQDFFRDGLARTPAVVRWARYSTSAPGKTLPEAFRGDAARDKWKRSLGMGQNLAKDLNRKTRGLALTPGPGRLATAVRGCRPIFQNDYKTRRVRETVTPIRVIAMSLIVAGPQTRTTSLDGMSGPLKFAILRRSAGILACGFWNHPGSSRGNGKQGCFPETRTQGCVRYAASSVFSC